MRAGGHKSLIAFVKAGTVKKADASGESFVATSENWVVVAVATF
jgi:hypothetical protein